jgi:predicted RNA binding protein YcfA (HicA-like mRNA interferase family)
LPELRQVSGEQAIRALERLGFVWIRQHGSHVIMKKQTFEGAIGCVVPLHNVLAIGTIKSFLRQAQVTKDEFLAVLK